MLLELSELTAALRFDIAAARMAATISPATPCGISVTMNAGKTRSGFAGRNAIGHITVEIVEPGADGEKERELNQNNDAAAEQGDARFA